MLHPTPVSTALSHFEIADLEDQITELAAHIHAANYRFLMLVREFDAAQGWAAPGLMSCAHWLNWKCGIGMNAAREKVRVAHALAKRKRVFPTGTGSGWMMIWWWRRCFSWIHEAWTSSARNDRCSSRSPD